MWRNENHSSGKLFCKKVYVYKCLAFARRYILAIFVLLQHLYKLKIFLLVLVTLPFFAKGQDSIVLPTDYTPLFNWDELNDSLTLEYQTLYPKSWAKDSAFKARENSIFFDSIFDSTALRKRLKPFSIKDKTIQSPSLSETPQNARVRNEPFPIWIYWVVLLVLVGVIFLKFVNLRLFTLMFLSIINPKYCDEALREHDTPINMYNLMATVVCAIIYALFIWFIAKAELLEQVHSSPSVVFILTFVALAIFYLVRYLTIMIAAALLDAEYIYGVLLQVTVSGNMWMAMILLPALALINTIFFDDSLQTYVANGWIILLVYLVAKQVRVFIQVASSFPHSIIYLILYLCALEIAPYLAIFKLLVNKLG